MTLVAALLLASLPPLTGDDLALDLRVAKQRILVGEPTKVVVTWRAKREVQVVVGSETLWVDDGSGYRAHVEAFTPETVLVVSPLTLKPAASQVLTEYVVGVRDLPDQSQSFPSMALVFAAAGSYKVKLLYDGVVSNEGIVSVVSPEGRDRDLLLQRIAPRPELLTGWLGVDDASRAVVEDLLARYAGSSYLARPALIVLERAFEEAAAADGAAGRTPGEGDALRVFEQVQSLDMSGSAFGEDHLLLIARLSERLFDLDRTREFYEAVIERYPNGVPAVTAKKWLDENVADGTAPVLNLTVAPASLWPPNHKLVPITVAVQVSDDRDPNPMVKLVSIKCDDACDAALDIVGATYETDDRQFDLRSERKGTSAAGRTYTITYSAEDAAGNKATTETKVTIAHDQGKKK